MHVLAVGKARPEIVLGVTSPGHFHEKIGLVTFLREGRLGNEQNND